MTERGKRQLVMRINTLVPGILAAMLACSAPLMATPTATTLPSTPTPTPTLTPVYSPTPDLPSGWVTYRSDELAMSLYHPSGWEVQLTGENTIDVREKQGQGWIEIALLNTTTSDRWGLDYTPGMTADAVIGELGRAAAENGVFEPVRHIQNRSDLAAWGIQGHYDVLDDNVLVAAISLADRGFIMVGHGGSDAAEWGRLKPIYEQIVWSITP